MHNESLKINEPSNFLNPQSRDDKHDVINSTLILPSISCVKNNSPQSSVRYRKNIHNNRALSEGKGKFLDAPDRVDALFGLVEEMKRHPECRLNANGRKYISLETDQGQFYVPCKKITLPSGGVIYAGRHQERDLFSDGENIYIDNLFQPHSGSFLSSMLLLLAQLTHVASYIPTALATMLPRYHTANSEVSVRSLTANGEEVGVNGDVRQQGVSMPYFSFPAAAAGVLPSPEFHHDEPRWPENITLAMVEYVVEEGDQSDKPANKVTSFTQDSEREEEISLRHNFIIDGQLRSLHIPLKHSKQLFDKLLYELNRYTYPIENGIKQLIRLDEFLGKKIKRIFGFELYLDHHNDALDTILFKIKTENLINECLQLNETSLDNQEKINHYHHQQIRVEHYIENMEERLIRTLVNIDHEALIMAIELKNGLNFEEALSLITDKYIAAGKHEKHRYVTYYKMIHLMRGAHKIYSDQLLFGVESTPLDRVLYQSDREIYGALIEDDNDLLNDLTLRRLFHIIFEHNRMNAISVHGNYFIIPGEITEFGNMFVHDEKELSEEEIITILNEEIKDFYSNNPKTNNYLDRLLALINQLIPHDNLQRNDIDWFKANMNPYLQIKASLEENIKVNIKERAKIFIAGTWRDNFSLRLRDDKIFYALTELMIDLQKTFNENIRSFQLNQIPLTASSREQRIVMAKEKAVQKILENNADGKDLQECLDLYEEQVRLGNMKLLIYAAARWWYNNNDNPHSVLSRLNVLSTIKLFLNEEQILGDKIRHQLLENYTSIYKLKRSQNTDSLTEYYEQFIEYKLHDAYMEARNQTIHSLVESPFDHVDLIFPVKNAYTFKVYSRNYIQNTLVHHNWVSSPVKNIGFMSLIKTYSGKESLISSLSNFAHIRLMSDWSEDSLVTKIIDGWNSQPINSTTLLEVKIPTNDSELISLFTGSTNRKANKPSIIDYIITMPEDNQYINPQPPYILVPVKQRLTSTSLIEHIDRLNYETLIELADSSKEALRDYNWVDYLLSTIPFYSVLEKNWNDADNQLAFRDVLFDLFDLIMALFPSGISVNRLTHKALMEILLRAKVRNVPRHMLKSFFKAELLNVLPELSLYTLGLWAGGLVSYLNPIPIPIKILPKLDQYFLDSIRKKLNFISESAQSKKMNIQRMRSEWRTVIEPESLDKDVNGIYTLRGLTQETNQYIQDGNDFFAAFWDKTLRLWRVGRPDYYVNLNYAVPVKPLNNNRWALQYPTYTAKASPLFERNSDSLKLSHTGDGLQLEPRAKIIEDAAVNSAQTVNYTKTLNFFIEENRDAIDSTLQIDLHAFEILPKLVNQLNERGTIAELFPAGILSNQENEQKKHIIDIITDGSKKIQYRLMHYWKNKDDNNPLSQLVIVLNIGNTKLIIDLIQFRPLSELRQNMVQVQFYNDWLRFYKNTIPPTYSLVKYKDFELLNDALLFMVSEGAIASNVISGAYLLREADWYKTQVLRRNNISLKKALPLTRFKNQTFRSAARSVIIKSVAIPSNVKFSLQVMEAAGRITSQAANNLMTAMLTAQKEVIPNFQYLDSIYEMRVFDDLLKVNEGKLLVLLNEQGLLRHVLVSVGDGRFAGSGNHFFHSTISDRPAILVAEEMGTFEDGKLKLRESNKYFLVAAGSARGASETLPTMASDMPSKIVIGRREGEPNTEHIVFLKREEVLLGENWSVQPQSGLKTRVIIRAHGAPFNTNHMDALELSHVIRGLLLAKPDLYNFEGLQSIDLYSCFGGYGGQYSTAQILANELKVKVKAYPAKISQQIRERHPFWFRHYHPNKAAVDEGMTPATYSKMHLVRKRHARLHDLITMILNLKHTPPFGREERNIATSPSVYINIARLLLESISLEAFNQQYDIDGDSQSMLTDLIEEYALGRDTPDDIFIQAYLDVLYSVDAFMHLTKGKEWQR